MADLKIVLELLAKGGDKAAKDIGQVERSLAGLETKAGSAGAALTGLAAGATVAGLATVAAGIGASVVAATDFEAKMSAVKAVMAPDEVAQFGGALQDLALQLGKETVFSASEAAQGLEELVKAGVKTEDLFSGGARAALDLAAAGGLKVGEAAEIAANAMNSFGLRGEDMAHVADVIAGAANASAISVGEFKFSMSAVGAVAALAGQDFEQTATAIALMGNAGIKGSDAGTSLKTMLNNLIPTTKTAKEEFAKWGLILEDGRSAFVNADGSFKNLNEIAGILSTTFKDATEAERALALETMFGSDAIRAAAILTKAGAEGFDALAASIGKVTAQQVAAERMNNLRGSLEQLKGSLETAAITVGLEFTPVLGELVDNITPLVNDAMPGLQAAAAAVAGGFRLAIPAVREFFTFLGEHKDIITGVVAALATFAVLTTVAAGFTALTAAIGAASAAFGAIAASGGVIAAVVAIMGGPLTLALAAIAAAVGVLAAAWIGNWGDIQGKTRAVVEFVKTGLESWRTVFEGTERLATGLARDMGRAFDDLGTGIRRVQDGITDALREGWDTVKRTITGFLDWLGERPEAVWSALETTLARILDAMHAKVTEIWTDAIPEDIRRDLEAIKTNLEDRWQGFQTFIGDRLTDIREAVEDRWEAITTFVGDRLTDIRTAVETKWQAMTETISARLTDIRTGIEERWSGFLTFIGEKAEAIRAAVQAKWDEIGTAAARAWEAVRDTIAGWLSGPRGALEAVTTWAGSVVSALGTLAQDALTGAGIIGGNVVSGIQSGISGAWAAFTGFLGDRVRDFLGTVKRLLGIASPSSVMAEIGRDLIAGIQQGMGQAVGGFLDWLRTNVVERIPQEVRRLLGIASPSQVFVEIGGQIIAGLVKGLQDRLPSLQGALSGIGGAISGALGGSGWAQKAMTAAREVGIDPAIFERQMRQESGNYAPDVISGARRSSAGAVGIAQFMPSTAAALGVNPLDPEAALRAAARYMRQLSDRYGSIRNALWAYNAGEGNFQRGVFPPETQNYLRIIMGYQRGGLVSETVHGIGESGRGYVFHGTPSRPEPVLSPDQWEMLRRGASGRAITIQINGATLSLDEIADTVIRRLQVYELAHAYR
jgi:TP901 family phage tail tape measure protein